MKKIVSLVLLVAMLVSGVSAIAETSDIKRFANYTDVDLNVFINKGYSCYYDDFEFMAEISPDSKIEVTTGSGSMVDTYTIKLDIKVLYSAGSCVLIPRMIFTRQGFDTYCDDRMSDVYIKNGENRYIVDVSGCSRSSSSKNYTATDSSVEPMYVGGLIMLKDLAEYPQTITVKMGSYADNFTLTAKDQKLLKDFYNDCLEAGIFNQSFLTQTDDYSIRTLFNENSVDATEDAVEEEVPSDSEQ